LGGLDRVDRSSLRRKRQTGLPFASVGFKQNAVYGRPLIGAALILFEKRFPVAQPLMPHATASWLVDNTALSFVQIANFCGLHILEIQAIADDMAATKLTGRDPIRASELTLAEIEKGQADPSYELKMFREPEAALRTKGPRYTPVSKRQDKPDGIAWIIRNHPEVSDGQIGKLIGTTRTTILAIRERSHWNIANITPKDPVTLGLCSQRELDAIVTKAAKQKGIAAQEDARLDGDRAALIEELRAERTAANLAADAVHANEAHEGLFKTSGSDNA
jgi:uncharacterized protein